jgi:mono/diheme cytochrome c family protein
MLVGYYFGESSIKYGILLNVTSHLNYCMMKNCYGLVLLLLFTSIFFSCQRSDSGKVKGFLNTDNLQSQVFEINANEDALIKTKYGTKLKLPAGFVKTNAKIITLEIKEAFSSAEIIQAGLTTLSNGKPLRSAGMIYINAKDVNTTLKLIKPIQVSMPAKGLDPDMKIFKGEYKADSTINWIKPVNPDTTLPSEYIAEGRNIFQTSCANCHGLNKNLTGPALFGITSRGPWYIRQNIYAYLKNTGIFTSSSPYVQHLKSEFAIMMPSFPALSNSEIDNIISYIQFEEAKENYNATPCGVDTLKLEHHLDFVKNYNRDTTSSIINDNFHDVDTSVFPLPDTSDYKPNVYQFEILEFGWYNVDAFLDNDKLVDIKIHGDIIGASPDDDMTVYFFDQNKTVAQYGVSVSYNKYDFDKKPEGLPYFINQKITLIIISSGTGQPKFAMHDFITTKEQKIDIVLKESNEKDILKAIKNFKKEVIPLESVLESQNIKKDTLKTPYEKIIMPRNCGDSTDINSPDIYNENRPKK